MQIQILSVQITTTPTKTGSYQMADVAFKNLTYQGKVEGKKVMSFGTTASSFGVLATAQSGDVYDVTVVKNDKGYNDWVSMTKGVAGVSNTTAAAAPGGRPVTSAPQVRSSFETPEERAAKQIYIIRQSSISAAVNALSIGSKSSPVPSDVIKYAQELEAYVVSNTNAPSELSDVPDFPNEAA